MDAKPNNYSEFSWMVFLDSVSKIDRTETQFPDSEITEQLEREWRPYLKLATETIQ